MKKIIIYGLVALLLVSYVFANPLISIGMQGLSFVNNPALSQFVSTSICVASVVTCVQGKITGAVTGEAYKTIVDKFPEVGKALDAYNQVEGYVKQGAQIAQELKVDKNGKIENGRINFGNSKESANVGNLINSNLKSTDIKVKGITLDKQGDQTTFMFQSGKNGEATIKGREFKNIDKGNIVLDKNGNIASADFTTDKNGGSYTIGSWEFNAPPNSRVYYDSSTKQIQVSVSSSEKLSKSPTFVKGQKDTDFVFRVDKGGKLELENGVILNQGSLAYKDGKIFIPKGTGAIINQVYIDNREIGDVFVDFNGRKLETPNYVSFNVPHKKIIIFSDRKGPDIKFEPDNPFIRIDKDFNDQVKLSKMNGIYMEIQNREEKNLVPSVDIIAQHSSSNLELQSGKVLLKYKDGKIRSSVIIPKGDQKEPNSAALSVEFLNEKKVNVIGSIKSPKKVIISSDNEFTITDVSRESDISNVREGYTISERFTTNYKTCPNCFLPRGIEIVGYQGKDYREILSLREQRELLRAINYDLTPAQRKALHKLVVYSKADWDKLEKTNKDYSGANAFFGSGAVHIPQDSFRNRWIFDHESAHSLASELPISFKEKMMEIQDNVKRYEEASVFRYNRPRWATGGISWTEPAFGCVSPYGCTNHEEDIAETSTMAKQKPDIYKKLIDPNSDYYRELVKDHKSLEQVNEWPLAYRKKLDLLYCNGFVDPISYKKITGELIKC